MLFRTHRACYAKDKYSLTSSQLSIFYITLGWVCCCILFFASFKQNKIIRKYFCLPNLINFILFFRYLPTQIGDLVQLRELMLNNNLLRNLPFELGRCFQLQSLGLAGNPLLQAQYIYQDSTLIVVPGTNPFGPERNHYLIFKKKMWKKAKIVIFFFFSNTVFPWIVSALE